MAKQLKTEKATQSGGVDPEKWESAPAEAVGAVSNASLASMTGGDAGTYEGIVDYILMEEERDAPNEQEIVAAENAGLLERNYPEEVESSASMEPHPKIGPGAGMSVAQPQLGDGGGGLEMGGLSGGDMGLDGLSEGTETSTAASGGGVQLGFGSSAVPTGISGGMDGGMVVDHKSDDLKVFKAMGGPDPAQLSAQNATALAAMQGMSEGLAGQIDSAVSGAVGTLSASYGSNDSALDAAFGANMSLIQQSFAEARSTVDASAIDAKARVEDTAASALDTIRSSSQDLLSYGDGFIAATASSILGAAANAESQAINKVSAAQSQAAAIAAHWAAEARRIGDAEAAAYRGRGNGGTEGKRDEARAQVAEAYGQGYQEDLPNVGADAVATLEEEKENIRSAIRELVRPLVEVDLPTLQTNLHAEVSAAAEEARVNVEEGRDEAFDSIDELHTTAGEELSAAESAARTDLIDVYGDAKVGLADMDSAGQQSVEAMGEGIRGHLIEKAVQLRSLIAKNPALPFDILQQEVAALSAELTAEAVQGQAAIQDTAQSIAEEESVFTQDAVVEMNTIGQSAAAGAAGLADQVSSDLDSLAGDFETGIDDLLAGFDSNLQSLRTQLEENVNAVLGVALGGLQSTLNDVDSGVSDFLSGFDADLSQAVNEQMMSDLQARAEEEAAKIKEPSLWDRVCAIVKVVLVIAVIVAISVVTAGVGGVIATAITGAVAAGSMSALAGVALTIVAGAAIGAVSSALESIVMEIAVNGFDPRNWDWKAIGMDALMGGVMGGLTAGLGVGIKAAARWGSEVVSGTRMVKSPAVQRIARVTSSFVDDAGELTKVGEFAMNRGEEVLEAAATWAITGERPDLSVVNYARGKFLSAVDSTFAAGMARLLPKDTSDELRDTFTSFMEKISEEARTGEKTDAILESLEVPVGELGEVDLTVDYQPEWTPTW